MLPFGSAVKISSPRNLLLGLSAFKPYKDQTLFYRCIDRHLPSLQIQPRRYSSDEHVKNKLLTYMASSRMLKKLSRYPAFERYINRVAKSGTVSTLSAFLVLHELTAILPLCTLWWLLYKLQCFDTTNLPEFMQQKISSVNVPAIEKLIGDRELELDKHKLIMSGAISYGIVKLLYPFRILLSLWAAPYVVIWIVSPLRRIRQLISMNHVSKR